MPAAKIFGPAFTGLFFIFNADKIRVEITANGLYFLNREVLNVKSKRRKSTGIKFSVTKNMASNATVKIPFKRATFSLIVLSEMGQIAFVFMCNCFKKFTLQN